MIAEYWRMRRCATACQQRRSETNRRPEGYILVRKRKSPRHDADDPVFSAVEQKIAANHAWVRAKLPLPKAVTDDHLVLGAGPVLFGQKRAAKDRSGTKHWEKIPGDLFSNQPFWFTAYHGQIEEVLADRGD